MKMSEVVQGLQILQKYFHEDEYNVMAEHDQIYVNMTDKPLSPENLKTLFQLGWFQPGAEEDEDGYRVYDPELGWTAYV